MATEPICQHGRGLCEPCQACENRRQKLSKMHGRCLSDEEAAELRKLLNIDEPTPPAGDGGEGGRDGH